MRALRRMLTITVLVFFGIGLCLFQPAQAQETPPEPLILQKLVASTGVASDRFGCSTRGQRRRPGRDRAERHRRRQALRRRRLRLRAESGVGRVGRAASAWSPRTASRSTSSEASVAIDGDTVVLGASRAKVGSVLQQGAVYVFERHAGGVDNWGQVAKLTDDSVRPVGNFGSSIAIEGDLLAVGASRGGGNVAGHHLRARPRGPRRLGQGHHHRRQRGRRRRLPPRKSFGGAVALDGDLLLVGAASADVSYFGEDDGAAYVFRRDAADRDRWNFVARLTAPEATLCPGGRTLAEIVLDSLGGSGRRWSAAPRRTARPTDDGFGGDVAIDGDTIVVGAAGAEAATGPRGRCGLRLPAGPGRGRPMGPGRQAHRQRRPRVDLAGLRRRGGARRRHPPRGCRRGGGRPQARTRVRPTSSSVAPAARTRGARSRKLVAGDGLSRENFGAAVALDGGDGIIGASGYELAQGAVYLAGEGRSRHEPAFPPTGELVDGGIVEGPAASSSARPGRARGTAAGLDRRGAAAGGAA